MDDMIVYVGWYHMKTVVQRAESLRNPWRDIRGQKYIKAARVEVHSRQISKPFHRLTSAILESEPKH